MASIESVTRVIYPKNDPSNITLMSAVPLAVIDASICWWVFSALIQTTRALRLRRNLVKLSVYKVINQIDYSTIDGNVEFVHSVYSCNSYLTSVNSFMCPAKLL